MITINPYLAFKGNCEEAFNFYRSVFGGEFQFIGRYRDLQAAERQNFASISDERIMHVSLPISKEVILMGCDTSNADAQATISDNTISLSINTGSKTEADRLFNALSSGGTIRTPINDTFWGSYFGDLTDKFGIHWMISFDKTSLTN